MTSKPRLLAVSGSLRRASVNAAVLRAAKSLAADLADITLFDGIGALPLFNPDDDVEPAHPAVQQWRAALLRADGLIIACPEYAHGVPGAFKNALDWVVASGEFVNKPVAQLNAAPRASLAQASLAETLLVMTAERVDAASLTLPVTVKNISEAQILADAELCQVLRRAVAALCDHIAAGLPAS